MPDISEADRFFGQQAVERGFVTQEQLDECFGLQTEASAAGKPQALGDLLVEQGFMTDAQIEEIQQRVRFMELRDQDRAFGKQCVKKGWLTLKQLDECLEIQRKGFQKSGEIRSLGEILVAQKMLTPETQEKVGALFGIPGYTTVMPGAAPAPAGVAAAAAARVAGPTAPAPGQDATELRTNPPGTQKIAQPAPADRPGTQKVPLVPPRPSSGTSSQAIPRKACPLCKALVPANAARCTYCSALFCPHCGHVSAARSPSCLGCGASFSTEAPLTVPTSMTMWLQPPYVYFLGMGIAAALATLVIMVGDPGPGHEHFEGKGHAVEQVTTLPPVDPSGDKGHLVSGGQKTAPVEESPQVYDGTVITKDDAIHHGCITERKDRVTVRTKYGELSIPRAAIKEIRKAEATAGTTPVSGTGGTGGTGGNATPGGTGAPKGTGGTGSTGGTPTTGTTGGTPGGTATGGTPGGTGAGTGANPGGTGGTGGSGGTGGTGGIPAPTVTFEAEPPDEDEEPPPLPGVDNQQLVKLKDGRELTGVVTRQGNDVEIRLKMGAIKVTADQVVSVVASPDQTYADLARPLSAGDAAAHLGLAQRMREQGCAKWARREYLLAIQADPAQAAAHRALGRFEVGGRWRSSARLLRHADACILTGAAPAAQEALEAILKAGEDAAGWDQPVASKAQKYAAVEMLMRCHLRAGRPADARAAAQRLHEMSIPSQRPRAKVLQDQVVAGADQGTVELRSEDLAVNLLDDPAGSLGLAPGPQPLWDARVLDILVRREAAAIVGKVKDRLDEAARACSADPDRALSLFEGCEAMCEDANELVPGFAKSYQLEAVRQQVPLLFSKAQFYIQKANESQPTKFSYPSDPKTKKVTPEGVKQFVARQREWNTWTERCKSAIDRGVRLAEKYPQEMQERLNTLREFQRYLNEQIPAMRKEIDLYRGVIGK